MESTERANLCDYTWPTVVVVIVQPILQPLDLSLQPCSLGLGYIGRLLETMVEVSHLPVILGFSSLPLFLRLLLHIFVSILSFSSV